MIKFEVIGHESSDTLIQYNVSALSVILDISAINLESQFPIHSLRKLSEAPNFALILPTILFSC